MGPLAQMTATRTTCLSLYAALIARASGSGQESSGREP